MAKIGINLLKSERKIFHIKTSKFPEIRKRRDHSRECKIKMITFLLTEKKMITFLAVDKKSWQEKLSEDLFKQLIQWL